jgi:hypothetical protein
MQAAPLASGCPSPFMTATAPTGIWPVGGGGLSLESFSVAAALVREWRGILAFNLVPPVTVSER